MSRKQFSDLLQKYHQGECTPQEKQFVENWFGLLDEEPLGNDQEPDWKGLEDKMWNQLHTKIQESENEKTSTRLYGITRYFRLGLAASVVAIASVAFLYRHQVMSMLTGQKTVAGTWLGRENTSGVNVRIRLEDGSFIDLAPGSSVQYPAHFSAEKRMIILKGKAFFDIAKSPERPFFVYSDHMVTRVLGTRFFVEEQKGIDAPQVEVLSGAVAVYEKSAENKGYTNNVLLKPNQQVKFYPGTHRFVKALVDVPHLIESADSSHYFKFYNTPLSKVLENLHRSYGIDIVLQNRQMAACPLTANLTGQPLYTQLDIICAAVNASYKIKGTSILIAGRGCNDHHITTKT